MPEFETRLPVQVYDELFRATPVALIVLRASDLTMMAANDAYLRAVGMESAQLTGKHVFDVFPNSPTNAGHDQATDLRGLFRQTIEGRRSIVVSEMRYDIPTDDGFDVRWWNVTETPILDEHGDVAYLLHYTEDVTELRQARDDLASAQLAEATATLQVASLGEVALALASAHTVEDLEAVVVSAGLRVLGAGGGAVLSHAPDGGWRVTATATLSEELRRRYAVIPTDSPFPVAIAARTGERVLLPTREEGLAAHPAMAEIYDLTDRVAFACLPLISQGRRIGALQMSWDTARTFSDTEIDLMEGFAAQCATALDRIEHAVAQTRTAEQIRRLAEALQSAMLTPPPQTVGFEIAVRYRPANDVARVGGDWYDAFIQPDGDTMLVLGDVSGHDDTAAAKMGQVRGLLRALAYDGIEASRTGGSPATVLTRFEHAARGLEVDQISTAILARVAAEPDASGGRTVWWTNAGNPPPVLLESDGTTRLLEDDRADLLLGIDPDTPRTDHTTTLAAGSTLLLYTDGLIERRDSSIDTGLRDLRSAMTDLGHTPVEELCDQVLARLDPHTGEDDIAMVALRV